MRKTTIGPELFLEELCSELTHQPGPRESPVAHDGLGGNPQHFCRFFYAQTSEEAEFYDLCLTRIDLSQIA